MKEIVIVDGARTAFGSFGGSLKGFTALELGAAAARGALEKSGVRPDQIDHTVMGNALQTSNDALYGARHVSLKAGVPVDRPAVTVNRICGSGLQAIVYAAQLIQLDEAEICLAGGMENMSQAPHVIHGARWGLALGQGKMDDLLWEALTDTYCDTSMAMTAENLAEKYSVTRDEADQYALASQRRAAHAREQGWFAEEITPIEIKTRKGPQMVDTDEHIRPDANLEQMAKLRPVFKKDGVVTAGNASGICDGAAAVVVASREAAEKHGLKILGTLKSHAVAAVEPTIMGIGPAPSIRNAARKAGVKVEDFETIEVNEAFAPQVVSVQKELKIDHAILNPNGGGISLGHPLGASGARLALTLLYHMRRNNQKLGVASLCIGGGQGIAAVFERA
ncbi:MAG TPA: acetyl-CoA C-acetyltransferase [candidate division Zixibacteria bacterium]|nr:acetyl-CoA C-acetyltransferase [candidate division Zixibacteria bacterium]